MAIVKFYGDLKQYGDKYKMNAKTAAEAINGLCYQMDDLKKKIMSGWFRVRINRVDINNQNLQVGLYSRIPDNAVIHIVPKIAGAKGLFSFIAGAAMLVAGLYTGQYWLAGLGFGFMAAGAAQMLTKLPKTELTGDKSNKSTFFSNLSNSAPQGSPVPLGYGRMMVGSITLSKGLETFDDV